MLEGRSVLLILSGGIAAYKGLELIRLLRKAGARVVPVLTAAAKEFVTPMSVAALAEEEVHEQLFNLTTEAKMGHIALSRQADIVVVAPASADILARMAAGIADDLATTLLLATDKPVLVAPAMNVRMWEHAATRQNVETLESRGVSVLPPDVGPMACGEYGAGRFPEPAHILAAIDNFLGPKPLLGRHALVTAGPTHEPIDPVRYLANRSSGKQGFAIAAALAGLGARVTLVAGPVTLQTPPGVTRIDVETARDMERAVFQSLPADVAVMVAAVADWRTGFAPQKIKKRGAAPTLTFAENPDILRLLATADTERPPLVIGFAAETDHVLENAREKLARKGADVIVANDVSGNVMGGERNRVHLVSAKATENWPESSKAEVAERLALYIAERLENA